MSTVTVSRGSSSSSAQSHDTLRATAPRTAKLQSRAAFGGVGPTASTGKSRVSYCPGGSRDGSAGRRPAKPRAIGGTRLRVLRRLELAAVDQLDPIAVGIGDEGDSP